VSELYGKISAPFKRHTEGKLRNKLDEGNWARPEFEALADLLWEWTEKVDGTNVRVTWDGYKVAYGGRTDDAQMPTALVEVLRETFPEELLEQQFHATPAVLYGEGFGAKIQNGGRYGARPMFILFDVLVDGRWWLRRDDLHNVSNGFKIEVVPLKTFASIPEAIELVRGGVKSEWGDFPVEGLVGRPPCGIVARDGDRLLVKIKTKDFR